MPQHPKSIKWIKKYKIKWIKKYKKYKMIKKWAEYINRPFSKE